MYLTFQKTLVGGQPTKDHLTVNMDTVRTLEMVAPVPQPGSAYRVVLKFSADHSAAVYLASADLGAEAAEERMMRLRRALALGDGFVDWTSQEDATPTVA
ncbi:hypothetical protein [Curtobacterium flaccumfaciens]|uniref:hypothetical protein n=1 Tax=Curtobacterium flaccumfaciens TaxID=2035 RepID=UPI001266A250|nr:hypothetical protein [Curtobacterium flaccumfaciens]MBT1667310.1 hypothetical protein [Curtobacterium flaccumfaciens pv. flaccumfaciens]QFS79488.1 hypothetical protein GBG65_08575 [Curtobacterium flaccumfaciens pv. flaccumfaciens]